MAVLADDASGDADQMNSRRAGVAERLTAICACVYGCLNARHTMMIEKEEQFETAAMRGCQ